MRLPLMLCLAVTTCLLAAPLAAQAQRPERARAAIDAVNTRFVDAYNRGDVAGFTRVYAPDAMVMPSNSPPIEGREAIAKYWQGGWTMGVRNVKLTTTELDVQGNSATEVGRYQFDIQPGSGAAAHDHGKYIVVWHRNAQGEWQWYRDIFNTDVPAMPAASSRGSDEQAVLAAERRTGDALRHNNADELSETLAEDYFYTGPRGSTMDKRAQVAALRDGGTHFESLTTSDERVRMFGNIAVVTLVRHQKARTAGGPAADAVRVTHVFERRNGRWLIVVSQQTPVQS